MLGLLCAALRWRRLDGRMGRWEERRRSAVLPVAVGHGILSLLLLEELCDGQQLFQHMLQKRKQEVDQSSDTGQHDSPCTSVS